MSRILLIFLIAFTSNICHAKPDCKNATFTPDINQCAQIELDSVEKKLNETYRKVLKSLNRPDEGAMFYSEIKSKLIDAQKAWVVFRQKDCDAYLTLNASGTIRTIMYIGCMQTHAEKRIKDISEYELY